MKITVLSKWYNEAELAPFFLNHYSYADEILIYLDKGTNDGSEGLIKKSPQAKIIWAESTGKLNDLTCITDLNQIAGKSKSDWLILVDADEYVFPQDFADPRELLKKADGNLLYSHMWNIFKHETELDLDPIHPSLFQRRHGNPNRTEGAGNINQTKPNIIKPYIHIRWDIGAHTFFPNDKIKPSTTRFDGVHWQFADIEIAVKRRIKGGAERMSETNLTNRWGFHNFDLTREQIVAEFEAHKHEPQLF